MLEGTKTIEEIYEEKELSESEQMAQEIQKELEGMGIANQVEVDFNNEYVMLNLSGAILFDNASAEIRTEAYPIVDKIAAIVGKYKNNIIEIEGHTDNV